MESKEYKGPMHKRHFHYLEYETLELIIIYPLTAMKGSDAITVKSS